MLLKIALLISMLMQLGATIIAISLIRRTRYNISWILISAGLLLMAIRRLFDFSILFWDTHLFSKDDINNWLGILISVLMFVGVIFIRQIFNLQSRIDQIRKENESRILSAVIEAEEKARRNFARDLHDGLGPVLSSVKMTLSAIDRDKLDEINKNIVERSCTATDQAIISLKEISNHLSPHLLENYGLIKAVRTFANQLFKGTNIQIRIDSNIGDKRFPHNLEISLYRIVSELFINSVKHAEPNHIRLEFEDEDQLLHVKYNDDGRGFDSEAYFTNNEPHGMGLDNIRSRIKSLNGNFYLDTASGKGLSVDIYIPVP